MSLRVDAKDFSELERIAVRLDLTRSSIARKAIRLGLKEIQGSGKKQEGRTDFAKRTTALAAFRRR